MWVDVSECLSLSGQEHEWPPVSVSDKCHPSDHYHLVSILPTIAECQLLNGSWHSHAQLNITEKTWHHPWCARWWMSERESEWTQLRARGAASVTEESMNVEVFCKCAWVGKSWSQVWVHMYEYYAACAKHWWPHMGEYPLILATSSFKHTQRLHSIQLCTFSPALLLSCILCGPDSVTPALCQDTKILASCFPKLVVCSGAR